MDPEELAARVSYVGSGEHKRFPNPLCHPGLRSDASDCDAVDPTLSQDPTRLVMILREAMRRGQVDKVVEGEFPRHAWGWLIVQDGSKRLFEARLTNQVAGQYKGYFIVLEDLGGKFAWTRRQLVEGGPWSEPLP